MTHQQLKEEGYNLHRFPMYGTRKRNRRMRQMYLLNDPQGKLLGSISQGYYPKTGEWGWLAYPVLKSDRHSTRKQPISRHRTVPEAATALIRFAAKPTPRRRPPVTCPRCGSSSRVIRTLGGVQERECKWGHLFEYDKWLAERIIWAPSAIGSLSREIER